MTRPRRMTGTMATSLTEAELARRARWGGLLDDVPALTADECVAWDTLRRGRSAWVPTRALRYAWMRIDPIHGLGGWTVAAFLDALRADEADIGTVVAAHPAQTARLRTWVRQMEAVGQARETTRGPEAVGHVYARLIELGFSGVAG